MFFKFSQFQFSKVTQISTSVERGDLDLSEMYRQSQTKCFHKCIVVIIQKIINLVQYILKKEARKKFTFCHLA